MGWGGKMAPRRGLGKRGGAVHAVAGKCVIFRSGIFVKSRFWRLGGGRDRLRAIPAEGLSMRPALSLLLLISLSACGLAGVKTAPPKGATPRLLPMEEILPAPVSRASDETAAALDARGAALRAVAQP